MTPQVPTQELKALQRRSQEEGLPPYAVLKWWHELPKWLQTTMQVMGLVFCLGGVVGLLVVEVFKAMPGVYGVYCLGSFVGGIIFINPPGGFYLMERLFKLLPNALAKFLPSRLFKRVEDRRTEGDA